MVLALLISDEMPQPLMEARMPFTELTQYGFIWPGNK